MDADQPLKVLFRTRPRELLALTGDSGARVHSAKVLELSAARRSVDLVLILERGGERYARHVEFQARHRADLARRAGRSKAARPGRSGRTCWRSCRAFRRDATLPGSWRG